MKFTSIPNNGSSWGDELIYAIDTEVDTPSNIVVDIRDTNRNVSLGRYRLYGVITAEINISPYLRSLENLEIKTSTTATSYISPASRTIGVMINGYPSDARTFFRAPLDYDKSHTLSEITANQTISLGDAIRLTAFAKEDLVVTINKYSSNRLIGSETLRGHTYGNPVEVVIPTSRFRSDTERIVVTIRADDGETLQHILYNVVERGESSRRLMWYNKLGGVECYTFPTSLRTRYKAEMSKSIGIGGVPMDICSRERHYRISSALETPQEMNRIADIVFSPHIYEMLGDDIVEVELTSREVLFDKHGMLRQLSLDICETKRGGSVC